MGILESTMLLIPPSTITACSPREEPQTEVSSKGSSGLSLQTSIRHLFILQSKNTKPCATPDPSWDLEVQR